MNGNGSGVEPGGTGVFVPLDGGARWVFEGKLNFATAGRVLEASRELPLPGSGSIDLARLVDADSAALAVLLALRRRAMAEGRKLAFAWMPAGLATLARAYGLDELLA